MTNLEQDAINRIEKTASSLGYELYCAREKLGEYSPEYQKIKSMASEIHSIATLIIKDFKP